MLSGAADVRGVSYSAPASVPGGVNAGLVAAQCGGVAGFANPAAQLSALASPQYLRVSSSVTLGLNLRTGASTAFPAYRLLTDTGVWYEVVGQSATTPVWYQIQYDATFRGWVHGDYVTLSEAAAAAPIVAAPTAMEEGSSGEAAHGDGDDVGFGVGGLPQPGDEPGRASGRCGRRGRR